MSAPRVTVVIPTRNRACLLPVAIRSALGQTMRDLEVIVVDDASDDGTAEAVAAFSDPRLSYIRLESRRGGSAARNLGIGRARSEFVAFLDDDDEWLPEKLELQMECFHRGGPEVGVVYSGYAVVDLESGRVVARKVAERRGDLSRDLLVRNVVGGTSSVVVRRSCLERAGLFDERLPSFQDYDLWLRLSRECRFDFVERDLLKYSVHNRKIWCDLTALENGIVLMREKHGTSRDLRRNLARASLGVGVRYCSRGQMREGRRCFRSAIGLDCLALKPYLNLALSFLGGPVFRAAHGARRRLSWSDKRDPSAAVAVSEPASTESRQ